MLLFLQRHGQTAADGAQQRQARDGHHQLLREGRQQARDRRAEEPDERVREARLDVRAVLVDDGAVGADVEGWLGSAAPDRAVFESGWTFPLSDGQGPLTVAVRIWHRWLEQHLTAPALSGVPVPQNLQESLAMLAAHSTALLQHRLDLSSQMGVPGSDGEALTAAASHQIQFAISEHKVDEERDRGVWFRELAELTAGEEVVVGDLSDPAGWAGHGRVDSFVTTSAAQSASRDLQQMINAMVGRTWL